LTISTNYARFIKLLKNIQYEDTNSHFLQILSFDLTGYKLHDIVRDLTDYDLNVWVEIFAEIIMSGGISDSGSCHLRHVCK